MVATYLVTGTLWAANNPFVGDWKLNPSRSKLTDVMKVEDVGANTYVFNFGDGAETVIVDGTDQAAGFGTTLYVKAERPNRWRVIRKKDGRMLVSAIWNLSEDGTILTDHYTGFNPNGSTNNLDYVYKRKAGRAGFAGEWVSTTETVSSTVMLQIRPYKGDGLSFIDPSAEQTQNVRFDAKDYLDIGPNVIPGSTSSVRRVKQNTLEIACKINRKVVYTQKMELSSDSNTLTITRLIIGEDEPNIQVFERQ